MRGSVVIEGLGEDAGRLIRLELQNEHLVALERGQLLASVPDLITVLDSETADAGCWRTGFATASEWW